MRNLLAWKRFSCLNTEFAVKFSDRVDKVVDEEQLLKPGQEMPT